MIVSSADVSTALRRDLGPNEAEFLAVLLPALVADAEGMMGGHTFEIAERTELGLLLLPAQDFISLRWTPVISVSSLSIDGVVWDSGAFSWERGGIRVAGSPAGLPLVLGGALSSSADVTYTAGLGEPASSRARIPILLRAARLVSKFADDVLGLDSLNVPSYVAKYLTEGWTADEAEAFDRAGRRRRVSALQSPTRIPSDTSPEWWGSPTIV